MLWRESLGACELSGSNLQNMDADFSAGGGAVTTWAARCGYIREPRMEPADRSDYPVSLFPAP